MRKSVLLLPVRHSMARLVKVTSSIPSSPVWLAWSGALASRDSVWYALFHQISMQHWTIAWRRYAVSLLNIRRLSIVLLHMPLQVVSCWFRLSSSSRIKILIMKSCSRWIFLRRPTLWKNMQVIRSRWSVTATRLISRRPASVPNGWEISWLTVIR